MIYKLIFKIEYNLLKNYINRIVNHLINTKLIFPKAIIYYHSKAHFNYLRISNLFLIFLFTNQPLSYI